ncbi:energy-coupling factor ABC transporter ATP-binding protein [Candidatus Contubernalis alkaliaceticus]|uniref:energy-coupling factor ABC transporter ATP-binding protein n=1 Tax=Candidatus Contubernalis alkaliaceticus TaxID=338645 RepID=UPI001F4C4CB6|nr:ABC transporter ATP-binding protein [Candidatus Contubernalis alkalaceticus]UNC91954.1 ABC transporter ATP-binding protein [Candidatus Contubernalis alkalaceticus]
MNFINLQGVSYAYPRKEEVFSDLSFSIKTGDTVALNGPNGCGKTTLGKVIMGIYQPTRGKVLLEGKKMQELSLGEIGQRLGYIFQNPEKQIFTPSVQEEVSFGLRYRGLEEKEIENKVEAMLSYFDLQHCRDNFPFNLSQGEKQRLVIAAILALEPKFIIFDEPTTGLDYVRKHKFAELLHRIKEKGVGYILISHDYEFSQSCTNRTLSMKEGKIYEQ